MTESSRIIYTLEEQHYEHTVMTLKNLINTIYDLEGLIYFCTTDYTFIDRINSPKTIKHLEFIYKCIIEGFKDRDSLFIHFWCEHKMIHMRIRIVDECLVNPINSKIYIEYFKEEIR